MTLAPHIEADIAHYPYDPSSVAPWVLEIFPPSFARASRLCEHYVRHLCLELAHREAWPDRAASGPLTEEALIEAAGYGPGAVWLLRFALDVLRDAGWIRPVGRGFRFETPLAEPSTAAIRARALEEDPSTAPTYQLLDRAAELFPAVLRGADRAERTLLGPSALKMWLAYFDNANRLYAAGNDLTAEVLVRLVAEDVRDQTRRPLRLVELGAGAGSGAVTILETLRRAGLLDALADYKLIDREATLLRMATGRLRRAGLADLTSTARADFEVDGELDASWPEEGADLVVAVNALHAAADLLATLRRIYRLLRPGGRLLLGECIRPLPDLPVYPEFFFLLLPSFRDVALDPELRPRPGFLEPEQWVQALRRAGFSDVVVTPDFDRVRAANPRFFAAAIQGRKV